MPTKDEFPQIEDIPLPPKPEEILDEPKEDLFPELEDETQKTKDLEEPPKIDELEDLSEPDKLDLKDSETKNFKPQTEEEEFSLPDFDDEDLSMDEDISSEEAKEELKPFTKIKSIQESPTPTIESNEKGEHFIEGKKGKEVLRKIDENQESIKKAIESFTKTSERTKNTKQLFKLFHDNLDVAQEKLMQIDDKLFENKTLQR